MKIEDTIKIVDIEKNISCKIKILNKYKNGMKIKNETIPKIPINDYAKYSIKLNCNNKDFESHENKNEFFVSYYDLDYPGIYGTIELKWVEIKIIIIYLINKK